MLNLMKICNEKNQAEQRKIFEEKPSESRMELNPVSNEMNRLRSEIKGAMISEQDLTKLSYQLVKSN